MSYKIIIIDDEKTIREGLSTIINWNSIGFEIASCFSNGKQAVEYIEHNSVDVVLTDIRMAKMTGLDVARYISEHKKWIKVVFLTGHKDFEYAKQAVEFGVIHYLLKPTQLTELYEVFTRIKNQIDDERDEIRSFHSMRLALTQQFFSDIFFGALKNKNDIRQKALFLKLNIPLEHIKCAYVTLCIKNYEEYKTGHHVLSKDQFYTAIHNFLSMRFDNTEFISVYSSEGLIKYIVYRENEIASFLNNISNSVDEIQGLMKLRVEIRVEETYDSIFSLAERSLNGTAEQEKAQREDFVNFKTLIEQQKLLITYLFSADKQMAEGLFGTIVQNLEGLEMEVQSGFIQNLFNLIDNKLMEISGAYEPGGPGPKSFGSSEEIYSWGTERLNTIMQNVQFASKNSENLVVSKAKDFVEKNYFRDISLEDVGNHVFLSQAYFSRIFKKYSGENFSEYLLKYRMRKAMQLLRNSHMKVNEISEQVGFRTLKYFYKLFKQHTGITPTEYRFSILEKKERPKDG